MEISLENSNITTVEEDSKEVNINVTRLIDRILRGKTYSLQKLVHDTLPNLNASRSQILPNTIKKSEWKVSLPVPVFISPIGLVESDPCHRRTYEYRNYVNRLRKLPITYKTYQKKKIYRNARKKGIYPYTVLKFAELLEKNPDEYFSARYDWFYTGGNLETFSYNDQTFLAHATGRKVENVDISRCENINNYTEVVHILSKKSQVIIKDNENPEILEIQHLNESDILVRRRDYISLYTYGDSGLKYRYHLNSSTVPFISSSKESLHSSNILTTDLNQTVALWDLNVSAQKPKEILFNAENSSKDKNWNCIRYLDEHLYVFADLYKFNFLDSRQPLMENAKSYKLYDKHERCETNCSICVSNFDNLIYFGSSHKLTAVDKRFVGDNLQNDKYTVLKWTHQMIGFPLILRTTMRDNVEMILMSSSKNGDVRLCENSRVSLNKSSIENNSQSKIVYHSSSLPMKPPSIADAYRRARLDGFCLDPYTSMSARLNYSHTGMVLLNYNNYSQLILTANSNGDLFSQNIIDECEEEMLNEDNLATMKNWEDTLKNVDIKNQPALNITDVQNLHTLKKVFQCNQLDIGKSDEELLPKRLERLGRWQRSIKALQRYKDALASDILSIWDIEPDDGANSKKIILPSQTKTAKSEMISRWLDDADTVVDENALSSVGINILDTSTNDVENTTLNTTTVSRAKQSVKRKYVKGF